MIRLRNSESCGCEKKRKQKNGLSSQKQVLHKRQLGCPSVCLHCPLNSRPHLSQSSHSCAMVIRLLIAD